MGDDVQRVVCAASSMRYDASRHDGHARVYFPIQKTDGTVVIRAMDVSRPDAEVSHVMDVVLLDGTKRMTVTGCRLTTYGMLWMCINDLNRVIGCDLTKRVVAHEMKDVPGPRDLCCSDQDENILFVVGGTAPVKSASFRYRSVDESLESPIVGQIIRVCMTTKTSNIVLNDAGLRSPTGVIEYPGRKLYVGQLYEMREVDLVVVGVHDHGQHDHRPKHHTVTTVAWDGTADGGCFLMDKLSRWDENLVITTLFRKIDMEQATDIKAQVQRPPPGWLAALCGGASAASNVAKAVAETNDDAFAGACHFLVMDVAMKHKRFLALPLAAMPNKATAAPSFDGRCPQVLRHARKLVFICVRSNCVCVVDDSAVDSLVAGLAWESLKHKESNREKERSAKASIRASPTRKSVNGGASMRVGGHERASTRIVSKPDGSSMRVARGDGASVRVKQRASVDAPATVPEEDSARVYVDSVITAATKA